MSKIEVDLPETKIRYQYDITFTSVDLNAIFQCLSSEEERIRLLEMGKNACSSMSMEET